METANNNAICNSKKDASRANVVDSTKNGYCIYDIYCWLFQICLLKDTKNPNNSYELREVILDGLVQFFHLPGMATELYLNYDCDSHCSNLYEDTMKLLSKQAFTSGNIILSTNLISLDGLSALIDSIEENCNSADGSGDTL